MTVAAGPAPSGRGRRRQLVTAVAITALTGAAVAACSDRDGPPGAAVDPVAHPPTTPPTAHERGVTMAVTGQVRVVVDAYLFQVGRGDAEPVLVFDPAPSRVLRRGDAVEVTGTVRPFVRGELEREYRVVLDPERSAPFAGGPVLVAAKLAAGGGVGG